MRGKTLFSSGADGSCGRWFEIFDFGITSESLSSSFLLGFQRQTCLVPSIKSSFQCPNLLITVLTKLLRQTGAGILVRSSAVRDNGFVLGNLGNVLVEIVQRNANRPLHFHVRLRPCLGVARIDE